MKRFILATALVSTVAIAGLVPPAYAESAPCEDMLKTLTDTMAKTKLSDADMKKVTDLKAKAEERCTAEDDKRSDGFVADAMKIIGK